VFDWLQQQGRLAALIRQISNPMAGVDTTLLALAGTGFSSRRAFGFMSCERVVGAAEGMNVLRVRADQHLGYTVVATARRCYSISVRVSGRSVYSLAVIICDLPARLAHRACDGSDAFLKSRPLTHGMNCLLAPVRLPGKHLSAFLLF
jgi:hypothetical protein